MVRFDIFNIFDIFSRSISTSLGESVNMCWNTLTNSGTIFGYISGSIGTIDPEYTSDGTYIYQATTDTSNGLFIFSFGIAGDESLTNTSTVIFEYRKNKLDLQWDDVNLDYRGTNTIMSSDIASNVGNNVCFIATIVPDKFIHLDYTTTEVE